MAKRQNGPASSGCVVVVTPGGLGVAQGVQEVAGTVKRQVGVPVVHDVATVDHVDASLRKH